MLPQLALPQIEALQLLVESAKESRTGHIKKAKSVGYELNFNKVTPGWIEEPEEWFARVENVVAPALREIIKTKKLTKETLVRVLPYFFILFGRNPAMRAQAPNPDDLAANFIDKMRSDPEFARTELQKHGLPCGPMAVRNIQWRAWNTSRNLEGVNSQDVVIDAEFMSLVKHFPTWSERVWSLRYTSRKTGYLITGDVPVSVVSSRTHGGGKRSVGIGSVNTEIIIPIHKTLLLMGENTMQIEKNGVRFAHRAHLLSEQDVGQVNLIGLVRCSKQIYSPAKKFKINNKIGETIVVEIPTKKHTTVE